MRQDQRRKAIHHQLGARRYFRPDRRHRHGAGRVHARIGGHAAGPTAGSQPLRAPGRIVLTGLTTFAPAPAKAGAPNGEPSHHHDPTSLGSTASSPTVAAPITPLPSTTPPPRRRRPRQPPPRRRRPPRRLLVVHLRRSRRHRRVRVPQRLSGRCAGGRHLER